MYRDFFGDDGGVNEREFWGTDEGGGECLCACVCVFAFVCVAACV